MPPSGLPVTAAGLPSRVAVYSQWIFEPSVPTRSTAALTAGPTALKVDQNNGNQRFYRVTLIP
jgi:hypothetical protein